MEVSFLLHVIETGSGAHPVKVKSYPHNRPWRPIEL
jgi:hypothetical protein